MSILQRVLNKLRGCEGVVLFDTDVRNSAIEQLKRRTKLKVIKR